MEKPLKILMLEDSATDAEIIKRLLKKEGRAFDFKLAMNENAFLDELEQFHPDIILADNSLPRYNATQALGVINQRSLHIPFILVTGTVSEEFAANIIKQGADDYILKDRLARLPAAIDIALRQREAERQQLDAAERLKRSEESYRSITERISDGFVALDKDWCYTYVNKQAGEILNRNPNDLIGKNIWIEFPEGIDPQFYTAYYRAMNEQQYVYLEEYYAPFNIWLENHIYPSPDGLSIFFRDISEKKIKERELRIAHDRLSFHIENAPLGFIEWDNQLHVKYWSKRAEEILGWSEGEIILMQKDGYSNVYEQDLAWVGKIADQLINGEIERNSVQHRNYTKDGRIVWCEWFNSVLKDKDGKVMTILSLVQDISKRKEAEQKIIQSEINLKAIFDNTSEGFILTDAGGIIKAFNSRVKESTLFNVDEEIISGRSIYDFVDESEKEYFKRIVSKVMQGQTIQYDRSHVNTGGVIIWISFTFNPVIKENSINGICITSVDITEKKIAAQQKEFDRNNLHALINNTRDLMWSVDRDYKLITSNQAFDEIVKIMSGNAPERGSDILNSGFTEEQLLRYKSYYERAFAGETFTEVEHSNIPEDFWSEISFYPIHKGDSIVGTACFSRNITKQKKAEEEIKQSNERFEMVVSATNDVIRDWEMDTDKLWWNKNYYSHFGYEKKNTLQGINSWYAGIHPDDKERVLSGLQSKIDKQEDFWADEYRFLNANKSFSFILDCGYILYTDKGKPYRMVGAMLDITGRKKAEELLRQSFSEKQALAERMSTILNTLPANIALLDENGFVIDVNDAWRSFGNNNGFIGSNYGIGDNYIEISLKSSAADEEDGQAVARGINDLLKNKTKEFIYEYPCHSPGVKRWFRMIATALENKEYAGAVVMHIDISELRRLEQERLEGKIEEQKRLTQAMLSAQEKERNAIGAELHDNVNQILVGTNLLLTMLRSSPEKIGELIPSCIANIKKAVNENRKIAHELVSPDLATETLLFQVTRLCQTMLQTAGLQTYIYHEDYSEERLNADQKLAVYRVAQEQCTNIVKYAHASTVVFSLSTIDAKFIVGIADDGQGMEAGKIVNGIGLRNITSRLSVLGGTVNIETEPGNGFLLEIEIPLS